jgi:hypothetical protein
MNTDIFTKLLMMTTSTHDNEALIAIRKANAMLASNNQNWAEFLAAGQTAKAAPQPPPKQKKANQHREPEINHMFDVLFQKVSGGFLDFVEDVHVWWQDNGFLTDKQYDAIQRAYHMRK